VAPDVACLLADALGVELELVPYDSPGALAAAAADDVWDVAVLGAEPARAEAIAFTAPFVEVDATFAVPPASPLRRISCDRDGGDGLGFDLLARVDRPGARVAVAASSAYDLWLTRRLKRATLVRGAEGPGQDRHAAALHLARHGDAQGAFDALAGLRPWLVQHAAAAGWVVLPGRFTAVAQALGRPRRCADGGGSLYLERFVGDLKGSGRAQALLEKYGIQEVASVPK
jgi:polar amino acid transport system substrate-binding protein